MKPALLFLFLCLLFISCKDKTYDCADTVYPITGYIGLAGFTAPEIDTVVLHSYEPNGTFNHLTKSDTIITSDLSISKDTAYNSQTYNFFGVIDQYSDYELIIPGAMRNYHISKISYSGDTIIYYTRKSPCGGRTWTNAPDSATVNGNPIRITVGYGATSILFLHK